MSFRFRLASFFIAALVVTQLATALLVYQVTRRELVGEGQRQLGAAAQAFAAQLQDISGRVAGSVQILSLDYALRAAIAQHDEDTLLSALRNHGRRVGASQMLVVDLDGKIEADTLGVATTGTMFPHPDLLADALEKPASAVVAMRGHAYWMVVVPMLAPDLVGFIAAAIPIDDATLAKLQHQSALPRSVELAVSDHAGRWIVVARGMDQTALAERLLEQAPTLPKESRLLTVGGREYVARAVWLDRARSGKPVAAVLGYSVDEALSPYRRVALAWGALLALGLAAGLAGAWLVARSVSRPVEDLAAAARRIAGGDYDLPPPSVRRDEIGQLAGAFSTMANALREREARILHQAGHDPITGLANRMAAETAIARVLDTRPLQEHALLIIGLKHLPEIVRTLGHEVSDRVMREAGRRLLVPAGKALLARVADDEFCVLLAQATRAEAAALAMRMVDTLVEPYHEDDLTLDLAPVVGIALAPAHGEDAGTLLRHAGVARMAAVRGEDAVAVYQPDTDPHRPERLSLMSEMRQAIDHDALHLHFQPKLALASGRIDGAEGLVRWSHPQRGAITPDTFIPLAEETGNIRRLTRWALAAGVAQAGRWEAAGHDIRVAINVSARDLEDRQLPRRVADLLALHRLPAQRLQLEITESAIMHRPDTALDVLGALAAQGIDLAIDDFGVGQSSLSYLRRLPVRELKIDRSFITSLAHVREDRTIVRSIVELGHQLGYRVTAEGVEDAAALVYLTQIGCDHAQGYYVSAALDTARFEALLQGPAPTAREPRTPS
ncbi:diguanylate cyclase (GGDEF) domain-containing protein [Pseudoxanthomonas sp. GM95]|uniref:putative bifunctional diguanylate cyclase/phosphodiesterase n=1 Tax=Pseudoxanthomonas sp. GM95 TaxID=1881043 RepID=UPI0008B1986E|nr:EAL domain-containing protein [Pseudoxanthomonas sp. GM95]SEM45648.1 diguanylate cyclase (GGDEF) domain-containing protein [Pseudoxanthomonas sp. GM95]